MHIERISKFDTAFIKPLSSIIYDILNDNKLTLDEKQLAIEKTSLNSDLNWLNMEGLNKVSVKNIILQDIKKKINKGLMIVISQYKKNNYRE